MRERVELLGGELRCRPGAGGGFRVHARIPLDAADARSVRREGDPARHDPVRVLIADDQALVRTGFRMILDEEESLSVIGEATDGLEAVEMARGLKPDVVLMDIRMPGIDGIEATRQILAEPLDPPVRVLVLTTFDLNEYVYDALRAGASGFLLKDVPAEQLIAGVHLVAVGRGAAGADRDAPPDRGVRAPRARRRSRRRRSRS